MNDKKGSDEGGSGRDNDVYRINSQEGQKMDVSMTLQYHVDPTNILHFHTSVHSNNPEVIGDNVIRPVLMRITKDNATVQTAISNYSGEGLVRLQQSVSTALTATDGELRQKGIIVDTFVIEHIKLDEDYIGEIQKKQVAQQRTLRANEETKASEAEALQAKAQAQADLNRKVVEAERDKQVAVLAAEAAKERTRLDAEAEKIKLVTTAEGTKEARTLEAAGILAVGQAEAEAQKLRLTAYNAPGSELFVKVEIAKYLSQSMSGIKGFLPEGINVTTLGQNFNSAVENILGAAAAKTLNSPESVPTQK
jgi:regulator of protease activity HflC (stomatin/prohibitin superfamily)